MNPEYVIEPEAMLQQNEAIVFDCRFSLADPQEGISLYREGHVPGAFHLDLARDLSGPVQQHGGRHPLPDAHQFSQLLAGFGVDHKTQVIAYDDSRFGFSARLWWMMCALGYRPPRLLNGGYRAFLAAGGKPEQGVVQLPKDNAAEPVVGSTFGGQCHAESLAVMQSNGALLIDSREPDRYAGLAEPIDPIAGHIPGAVNFPWQAITDDQGRIRDEQTLRAHFGDALEAPELLVYCGSGVTACVNLFSLALLGRSDAKLYAGSWSDWCSYL